MTDEKEEFFTSFDFFEDGRHVFIPFKSIDVINYKITGDNTVKVTITTTRIIFEIIVPKDDFYNCLAQYKIYLNHMYSRPVL